MRSGSNEMKNKKRKARNVSKALHKVLNRPKQTGQTKPRGIRQIALSQHEWGCSHLTFRVHKTAFPYQRDNRQEGDCERY